MQVRQRAQALMAEKDAQIAAVKVRVHCCSCRLAIIVGSEGAQGALSHLHPCQAF